MAIRSALIATLSAVALFAATPAPAENTASDTAIVHVLNRLGFGPTGEDMAHVRQIGIERYIDEQLHPEAIPEPAALTERLAGLDTSQLNPAQLFLQYGPLLPAMNGGMKPTPEGGKAGRPRA